MKKAIIFLFLCIPSLLHAQQLQGRFLIDSLLGGLTANSNSNDTNKVNLLIALAYNYGVNVNQEEGLKYADSALALSEKLGWQKGIAWAKLRQANNYSWKGDHSEAMKYAIDALKIGETSSDQHITAACFMQLSAVYTGISVTDDTLNSSINRVKAMDYALKGLKIYEALGDKKGVGMAMENIGLVHQYDFFNYTYVLGHRGSGKDKRDSAMEYYNRALHIFEEINDLQGIRRAYGEIGAVWQVQGKYTEALEQYSKAIAVCEKLDNEQSMIAYLARNGQMYLYSVQAPTLSMGGTKAANLQKAITYLSKAVELSKKLKKTDGLPNFYRLLADAYYENGESKKAFEYFKEFHELEGINNTKANSVNIAKLETERALEIKNKDIELYNKKIELDKLAVAKKKNERAFYIAGIILLVLVIVFIFRNYTNQKNSNKLLYLEKKRSDDLLLNILPAEVAEELKDTGSAIAKSFDDVTVLLTDFVDFTNAGQRMSPQELVHELDTCFKAFDAIIDKYNIEKIKTIGDAYLAVGGLPVADPLHAAHIVSAAIEINSFMNDRYNQIGDRTFNVRIGIHSGSVVAGIVGIKKFAYDIWGDTVNTAARMEQNSESGKINISQTTYELVKDTFTCTYRGEIDAKNKGKLRMYYVG